ncbi:MAG: PQQ-binding-like beta-propeller repeat protein [Candidatus Latescibacteria bacterium]|nr:PQQ-binding-like beta-propeller repeat protein [Candidatus Latescibacterota bacterium]
MVRFSFVCLILLAASLSAADSQWHSYGATPASSKYAPLSQIDANNFTDLQIAWTWASVDEPILQSRPDIWTMVFEGTPLQIGDRLYVSTSLNQVAALDAASGRTLWTYDPGTWKEGTPANVGLVHRGVSYWEDGDDRRIIFGTGDAYLIALNADSGEPVAEFGQGGRVDLTQGLRRPIKRELYAVTSPPVICHDVAVVGAVVLDAFAVGQPPDQAMPPGDVRGFDVRSGEPLWTFETIPQAGDFGNETWEQASWKNTGNTNVWTLMSADEELNYVYLPVSTPTNDYYGGHRLGDNLFAESLVCLNASTGERVWHFQIAHHGLWDYDLPAAPNLVDIEVGGRPVKAVAQVTKQGFCFVFDRVTGEPVWPIEEKPVPQSEVPGERSSPTQPIPSRPAPFERQGLTDDDLIAFTPTLQQMARDIIDDYEYGPLYSLPSEKGTIVVPGIIGGASWAGAAVDPRKGVIYIPSYTFPAVLTLTAAEDPEADYRYTGGVAFGPAGPRGLPLLKPPYGRLTAIDLNSGEHLWVSPVGEGPRDHPSLRHLDLPHLGWAQRNFPLVTETLLLAATQAQWNVVNNSPRGNAIEVEIDPNAPYIWAFNPEDGGLVGRVELPRNASGQPITYMAGGKQYIVVPTGGADQPAELVALSLP